MVFRPDWLLQILNSLVPCSVSCSYSLGVLASRLFGAHGKLGKFVAIENSIDM